MEALLNGKVESGVKKTNNYVIYIFMKPFTSKIQNLTHSNKESNCGCSKSPNKKIGLQGLGAKGNKGYHVGSPAKKKDACYSKVKSRYKKWPSAYASGALVKCRKVGAANWGNKSK